MHLGQVKGTTHECLRECSRKSLRPKGVLGLMHLGQVRGSTWECLKECSKKSPQPKGLGLMYLSQVKGSTQECLRECSGKSPQTKGDNPSKGQSSKIIKKREREFSFPNDVSPFYREPCCCRCSRKCIGLMYKICVTMHDSLVLYVTNFNQLHSLCLKIAPHNIYIYIYIKAVKIVNHFFSIKSFFKQFTNVCPQDTRW